MEKGYGFGAEGDWKVAAMVRLMKIMTAGKKDAKGTSCLLYTSLIPFPMLFAVLMDSNLVKAKGVWKAVLYMPALTTVVVSGTLFRLKMCKRDRHICPSSSEVMEEV